MKKWILAVLLACLAAGCTRSPTVDAPTEPDPILQEGSSSPAAVSFDDLAARAAHTATPLAGGDLFVAGGCISDGCSVATAQTFIVRGDGPAVVRGPDLAGPRDGHTATILDDGSVVLIGGYAGEGQPPLETVEVFDPRSGTVRLVGRIRQRRGGHASAPLDVGRVLVAGGWIARQTYTRSVEIVDLATNTIAEAAPLPVALHSMEAVTLSGGGILVTGGQVEGGNGTDGAWIYDPVSDSWSEVGPMLYPRFKHMALVLEDGRVLVMGGTTDDRQILSTTEIFDPVSGAFTSGPHMSEARYKIGGGAILVDGNKVLVGGGGATVEVLDLEAMTSEVLEDLGSRGSYATLSVLGEGLALLIGGYDDGIDLRRQFRLIPTG